MLIHAILPASRVNGPGLRAVVFVQGCSLNCSRCWNTRTHAFTGEDFSIGSVAEQVIAHAAQYRLDGVTFSGGEPMQQADELALLIDELRDALPNISMGMFTGYSVTELESGRFWTRHEKSSTERIGLWRSIRKGLDFAVMGRYNRLQPSSEPLRTSRNQELRIFTGRYTESDFIEQSVEVAISATGLTTITGFPTLGVPS